MSEFKVGDKVMHCREGLAVIFSTTQMADRDYFIVHSSHGDGEAIYVPLLTADSIIRKIMTVEEANRLLESLKPIVKEFNTNTKQRRDAYKRRLGSGDVNDIAYLFKQYYLYKEDPEGVKLGPADVDMLSYATNFLLDELSLTYEISREEIEAFVTARI